MIWVAVVLTAVASGLVQIVTGFGAGLLMMLVFPLFFDLLDASALTFAASELLCVTLFWQCRKALPLRIALPPTLAYAAANALVLRFMGNLDLQLLEIAFALFLIVLSLYYLLAADKVRVKPSPAVGIGCGLFSGVISALFVVGGPPMVVYFLAATDTHSQYMACIQFLFVVTNFMNIFSRMANGLFSASVLPYAAAGTVGVLVGMWIGQAVKNKLSAERIRMLAYVLVGLSGVNLLVQHF